MNDRNARLRACKERLGFYAGQLLRGDRKAAAAADHVWSEAKRIIEELREERETEQHNHEGEI